MQEWLLKLIARWIPDMIAKYGPATLRAAFIAWAGFLARYGLPIMDDELTNRLVGYIVALLVAVASMLVSMIGKLKRGALDGTAPARTTARYGLYAMTGAQLIPEPVLNFVVWLITWLWSLFERKAQG